ncbi:MAG: hypothetical protein DA330_02545 [Nitrososphaera sp.]|nr:hypothetical protein [Nitrososphaera sp.]
MYVLSRIKLKVLLPKGKLITKSRSETRRYTTATLHKEMIAQNPLQITEGQKHFDEFADVLLE